MGSTFSLELRDAFLIRIDSLRKIHSLLAARIGETKLSAECADNVTREFTDVAALTNYENTKAKRIVNLDLVARSDDWKKSARVSFSNKWYFGGTKVSIDARDDVVTRLRSDLLDLLSGIRPWYWPINRIDLALIPLVVISAVWLSLLVYVAFRGSAEPSPPSSSQGEAIANLSVYGFIAALIFGGYAANRVRSILFPHGTFLIGQEVQRFDTLEKWRWGLGIAIVASLLGGAALLPFT